MPAKTPSDPSEEPLRIVRRAYAKQMLALAGVSNDPRLEDAFASVPREQFVGNPPWKVVNQTGYGLFPSLDPVAIYQDVNIALVAERGVITGRLPSTQGGCMRRRLPRERMSRISVQDPDTTQRSSPTWLGIQAASRRSSSIRS